MDAEFVAKKADKPRGRERVRKTHVKLAVESLYSPADVHLDPSTAVQPAVTVLADFAITLTSQDNLKLFRPKHGARRVLVLVVLRRISGLVPTRKLQ